jgi:tetraacyldisaccharide 4'-kinase
MKPLLLPLSWLYNLAVSVRNVLFDFGLLPVRQLPVPVIAVGNLTAGGTGKTPLVEYLLSHLIGRGRKVAVISRGYGRMTRGVVIVSKWGKVGVTEREGGDEPLQIARKFPGVAVVVGESRVRAGRRAVEELKADLLLCDDAFQHRYLRRDLNILVLDAGIDILKEKMLPAGRRREPLSGMQRADIVAFSRVPEEGISAGQEEDVRRFHQGPLVGYRVESQSLRTASKGEKLPLEFLSGKKVLALSGIAHNDRFVDQVRSLGADVVRDLGYPDHYRYTPRDIQRILAAFNASGAAHLVTTEKDAARLVDNEAAKRHLLVEARTLVMQVGVRIVSGEMVLQEKIDHVLHPGAAGIPAHAMEGKVL